MKAKANLQVQWGDILQAKSGARIQLLDEGNLGIWTCSIIKGGEDSNKEELLKGNVCKKKAFPKDFWTIVNSPMKT